MGGSYKLDVLFFKERDVWVGQCLQYDIAAQAQNLRECMQALQSALLGRLIAATQGLINDPFKDLPPAPSRYWQRYHQALRLSPEESLFQQLEGVPQAFMIQASDLELRVD